MQHYNDGNPDDLVMKPAAPRGLPKLAANVLPARSRIIEIANWINVRQAQPSTVQTLDGVPLKAYSNADSNFDSTTLGFKGILKLARAAAMPAAGSNKGALVLGGSGDFEAACNFTGAWSLIQGVLRILPITADFDITTLTWNNYTALTFGAELNRSSMRNTIVTAGAQLATLINHDMTTFYLDESTDVVYGFLIECQANVIGAFSSIAAEFEATPDNPFLVLPDPD